MIDMMSFIISIAQDVLGVHRRYVVGTHPVPGRTRDIRLCKQLPLQTFWPINPAIALEDNHLARVFARFLWPFRPDHEHNWLRAFATNVDDTNVAWRGSLGKTARSARLPSERKNCLKLYSTSTKAADKLRYTTDRHTSSGFALRTLKATWTSNAGCES